MKTDTKRKRADWDQYFMDIAKVVSSRSTCDRKFVGAVIVRDKTILSTGYNGSIRKLEHCDEVGHMMENGHCVATRCDSVRSSSRRCHAPVSGSQLASKQAGTRPAGIAEATSL